MAVEEFQPTRKWFLKLTLRTKWIMPSERTLKTVPENGVGSCVHFCLRSIGLLGRCDAYRLVEQNLNETLKKVLKWGVIYHCTHTKKCIVTIFFYPSRPYKESLSKRRVY